MEISGEIIAVLPMVNGNSPKGKWLKQEYVMEVPGQYPKKVCFSLWNDKIDAYNLKVGQKVTAHIDIESREHNSRWYTEVKAWKVDKDGGSDRTQSHSQPVSTADPLPAELMSTSGDSDDLPF